MTTYYVGAGGNDGNAGTSWALRKLTLNGAEDIPVAANDTVYVGPGVYRELLTLDVSGAAGQPITYIADISGEHTDGVGGIVRITGSDNDQTAARASCILGASKDYRTFRGFNIDTTSGAVVDMSGTSANYIFEDCAFMGSAAGNPDLYFNTTGINHIVRRCYFSYNKSHGITFTNGAMVDNSNNLVENCIFNVGSIGYGINIVQVGGITVKNCVFVGCNAGIRITTAISVGQTITVGNCIIAYCSVGLRGTALAEIVENYNAFWGNTADRNTVNVGANSNAYPPLLSPPLLLDGFTLPWQQWNLSQYSQIARITDNASPSTDDFFGLVSPVTNGKRSWGAVQYTGAIRDTATVDSGTASIKLPDAVECFLMRVKVSAALTKFTIKCYREANYAGTNPQMILRQAGQADTTVTDTGAAGAWNTLTSTITPAADPEWLDVFIKSNNTAGAGNYAAYFDTLTVL